MKLNHIITAFYTLLILSVVSLTACQTSTATTGATVNQTRGLAPERVDIRGSVIASRYNEGQVVLEVENYSPSPNSRYNRAYVLVQPTAQMVNSEGQAISVSELRQGQNVAIIMRGGGRGNFVGVGVARKVWIEDQF